MGLCFTNNITLKKKSAVHVIALCWEHAIGETVKLTESKIKHNPSYYNVTASLHFDR